MKGDYMDVPTPKNPQQKIAWHRPPPYTEHLPKQVPPSTEGKCPYCHKQVQSLELHIHDKHLREKLVQKR